MNEKYLQGYFNTYVAPNKPDATYEDWVSKISTNDAYKQGMFKSNVLVNKPDATYDDWNAKVFGTGSAIESEVAVLEPPVEKKNPVEPTVSTNGSQDLQATQELPSIPSQPLAGLGGGVVKEKAGAEQLGVTHAFSGGQQELPYAAQVNAAQEEINSLYEPLDPTARDAYYSQDNIDPEIPLFQQGPFTDSDDRRIQIEGELREAKEKGQRIRQSNANDFGVAVLDDQLPEMLDHPIYRTDEEGNVIEVQDIDAIKEELSSQVGKARSKAKNVFDNPKAYGLPSDITSMSEEDIKHAQTAFVQKNEALLNSMNRWERERAININEGALRNVFLNELNKEANSRESERTKLARDERHDSLRAMGVSEEKIQGNMFRSLALEDVRKMSPDQRAVYENNELQKELANKINDTKIPLRINEAMDEYDEVVRKGKALKEKLGEDRKQYVNMLTGNHVDKIVSDEESDITEAVDAKKEEYKSLKTNIEDLYINAAIKDEEHRTYGKEAKQNVTISQFDFGYGAAINKLNALGYKSQRNAQGNYEFKDVSLSDLAIPSVLQGLSKEDQKDPERWAETNRENIIKRVAAKDMALLNLDAGKYDKSKIARGLEVISEETIGKSATENLFGYSDRKLIDAAIPMLQEQGIEITKEQEENLKRTFGMEVTEGVAAFVPVMVKLAAIGYVAGPIAAEAGLTEAIATLSAGNRFQKLQSVLLQGMYEEATMKTAGFETGTGFGFSVAGNIFKGLGIAASPFRFKGEAARLNKINDALWSHGVKGASASEFASNVETVIHDIEGSTTYKEFIEENYSDISEVGKRMLLNAAVFAIMGGRDILLGKGSTGLNIRKMEEARDEFRSKGKEAEAKQLDVYIGEYYEGKKANAEKKADKEKPTKKKTEETKKKSSIEEFVDINKQIDEIYKEELTPERDEKSDKLYADSYTAREKVFEEHATPEQKAEEKGIKDEEAKYDYKAKVVSEIVEKSKNETKTEPTKKKGRLTKFSSGDIFGEVVYEDGTRKDLTKDEYNDLAKEEGVFDVEETAPVDKRQQELDDAIAKADAEVAALRDADGSVSDENTVAFKAAVKRRSELQSQGEENKGEFSFREKAEVGKDRARYLTEEETKKADAIIQAIIDSGLKNGLSAEEISDQIINRHSFILTEVQAIKQYVAGLVNNATEQGNSKQSFSAWRQGKMDSDIKQSSKETPIEIKSPKEFLDDMEIDGEPPMLRAENPIDDVKAILDTYKSMLKDGSYGEGRKEELVKRIEETEAVIAKATEKPVAEKPKKEKTQTAPPKEETAPVKNIKELNIIGKDIALDKPERKDFKEGSSGDKEYASSTEKHNEKVDKIIGGLTEEGTLIDDQGYEYLVTITSQGVRVVNKLSDGAEGNSILYRKGKRNTAEAPFSNGFTFKPKETTKNIQTAPTVVKSAETVLSKLKSNAEQRKAERENNAKNETDSEERGFQERMAKHDQEEIDAIEKDPVSYLEKQIKTLQEWVDQKDPFLGGEDTVRDIQEYKDALAELTGTKEAPREETRATEKKIPEQTVAEKETIEPKTERAKKPSESKTTEAPIVVSEGKVKQEDAPVKVKSFKKGEGGTAGVLEAKDGKLYKSSVPHRAEMVDGKAKRVPIKGKETQEHKFLSENQDMKHLPKVGEVVETSEGKAFEIEKLNEVKEGSLTLEEINQVQETLKELNGRGVEVADNNTVMRRDNGEIVLVDLSSAQEFRKGALNETVSSNVVDLLNKNDKTRYLANKRAKHESSSREIFNGKPKPKTEFTYLLTQRPPSIGTHPEGQIRDAEPTTLEGGKRTAYKITYDRPLTEKEIKSYELTEDITENDIGRQFERVSGSSPIIKVITNVSEKGVEVETFLGGKSKVETVSRRKLQRELEGSTEIKDTPTKEVKTEKVSESETNKETASEADVIKDPIVKRAAKGFLKIGTKVLSNAKALQDFVNELTGKGVQTRLDQAPFQTRDGKRIGFNYDTEQVARERFDFSNLKEIGKGSDRTVFDLGDGKVLKVAHTARGLEQNVFEGDYYLADAGIMPEFFERGLNYIVMEKVEQPNNLRLSPSRSKQRKLNPDFYALTDMLSDLKNFTQNDFDRKTAKLQDVLNKHGLSDIMNYDVLWGDFIAKRNWGIKNGKPIHLDGGTFGGVQMITSHRGKAPLSDPEFRDIYEKSRRVKKEMGDTDKYTRFNITMPDGSKKEVQPSSPEVVNGFYSPLEKIISESKQDKMPAVQWAKKFAVGEEAKWTGLTEWLGAQEGSVTKAEIQEFLKDNRIEVVEVVKGDSYDPNDINSLSQEMFGVNFNDMTTEQKAKHREESDRRVEKRETPKGVPKYSDQQLEGEKTDYKEVLVTMPTVSVETGYTPVKTNRLEFAPWQLKSNATGEILSGDYSSKESAIESDKASRNLNYRSSHWDEPNILVHVRMNTRTDVDGKKVLFLEEVQSDWGQEGKKKGFAENKQNYALGEKRINNGKEEFPVLDQNGREYGVYGRLEDAQRRVDYDNKQLSLGSRDTPNARTPKAPFVTDTNAWVKLGLKVALKEAQKQGVDKIAWTTGEQQMERYDLSKQVDNIESIPKNRVETNVIVTLSNRSELDLIVNKETGIVTDQQGRGTFNESFKGKTLDEVIGKDIAEKALSVDKRTNLKGNDLKVGGKGMKGFYGSPTEGSLGIVGNVAKKLFKQTPKTAEINTGKPTYEDINDYANSGSERNVERKVTQHSIDLTPELKAEAQEGQPLFHYNEKGEILGVSYKDPVTGENKMALNGEKITAKTTFEEMGHTWINWSKDVRPDLHEAGLKKVGGSKYLKEVMADKNYQAEALKQGKKGSAEYNAYMAEEALAKAIADNGAKFVTGAKKASFQEWVMSMWRAVAEQFGIQSLTPKEIGKLTLDEFSKKAAADVFAKERTAEKVSESESNKVDVKKIEDEIAQLRKDRDAYLEDLDVEKAMEADNRIAELSSQLDTEIEQREFTEEERSEAFDDRKKKAEEDPEARDHKIGIIHDQFTGLNESDLVAMGWDVRSMKEDRKLYSGLIDFTEKGKKAKTKIEDMAAEMSESAGVEITTDDIRRYVQDIAREKNLGIDTYGKRRVGKGVKKETTTQKKERLKQERDSLWNEIGEDLNKSGFAKTPENEAASADKLLSDLMKLAKYELKISQLSAKEFIEKAIAHYGPTIKSVAAKAHKLAKMSFGATFEEYNEAIKEAKKDAAKALKEAVKEARRIESEKFKAKFEKFKAELKNKQAKAKGMATAVSEAKKEMRKAVRESELDFTKQQASKLMGIISEVTAKNFEKKIDSVNEYIDSLKEKQEQKEINNLKKALLKKMASSTHLYKSDGKKRKRIAISPEAQSELATLRREYKDQIKHMDNEAILALNELVDGIIETGKANQKDNIKARKAIRRSQKEQGTKLFSEKTAESIPLEGGKDAAMKELRKPTGELGGGNAILVGNTILLPDATGRKMAESMSESDFDNAVLIKIPPKGMIESASLLDQLKGFVMSKTDMRTISSLLMSDKASQEWWEDNLINPMIRASNAVFTDRMNLSQAFKSNREKAFDGRKKANKALKGKSGIHLKTSDGNTIIKDMTNDQVAYIYMAMLDPRNISKMFNGKMTSENLIEIANYVNSNPKLKSYAEGIINVYDSYLPTTNKALGEAGYQIIEPHNSADFKNQLLEGTGEALKEKKAILTSEIADLKEELKTTKTPESVEKKIAAKEKALEKLIETGESLEKAKRIYEAIYGDIENMPDVTPYAPSSVNQSEKDIATPDVQDMFTSKAHAPSVLSNNMIEKKSGGEFNPIMNAEAAFIRYAESMTNAANKIALYESVFSMLPKGGTIMKLMEQKYGSRVTQEMQQLMQNIVMEKNMQSKSAPNFISNWINRSQGTALFLNWKSAAFQTISGPNFLAEAIIKEGLGGEYFKNSNPFSEKNREALKEITESGWFIERMNKSFIPEMKDLSRKDSKGRIGWLDDVLTKGFYPNKFVDSKITIAYFGAPLYASLKGKYYKENLKTMPKAEAMADAQTRAMDKFSDYVNKSQQSAVQMYRSTEQNDTFKRALLTFGSVSLLYTRESIRTVADMKNGRTSLLKGMANIAYYQGMQNAIFFSLQEGILFTARGLVNMMMGSDDDEDKKAALKQSTRIVNQSANSILRGFGAYGASFAVVKDIGIDVFLRYAPREKHDEIEKNYNLIIDSLPDKKMKLRIASDALGQAVPTLGIKLRRLEKTFSLLDKSQNVDPNASSAEYIINKYIAPTASVAELANIPTSNIMRQIEAINDVSKDDMAIHEAFFRLIEVLPDYIHEDNKELNKVLSAEESRKKEKKESSEEKEASKQVAIEAIAAKSKTPYSESIRSSSVPYQQAKEYKDIANESRKTKISIEAAKSEIAEQYNVEVLKNTVEDNMLLDVFITSDGEGTTLRTKDIIASKYVDNVIEVKKNNLTEYALTKEHEEILKNALKHMDVMKRSALIRSINKEIATYKDRKK